MGILSAQAYKLSYGKKKWGLMMAEYIFDLAIVALLVIGLTATLGVFTNGLGERLFGGKKKNEFVDQSARFQTGWNAVGGKKK